MLDDLYVSPAVKRSIWRTLLISKEIKKITGKEPEKVFIEMARGNDGTTKKGDKTKSRKDKLIELLEECKTEEPKLWENLNATDEGLLRDNRLYLYYTQLGRCMYSNEKINLSDLEYLYDVDHIYPQSKVKDDSIHDNLVLVKKTLNAEKGDEYPIPEKVISKSAKVHWAILKKRGLIKDEKYNRLERKTAFSDKELSGFIARQLVETRQSTKALATILKEVFKESEIVYVKAENVSNFRKKYQIVKSRLVNDFHHAKDAYLNIVVGNVYHGKFTSNPLNFIKKKIKYSLNNVFEYTLKRGDKIIWDSENAKSLIAVKKQVKKNNILFTRYAFTQKGGLFDQNIVKAGKGQLPIKSSDERLQNIERYGAYNKASGAYFFLVEHKEIKATKTKIKETLKRSIEYVPIYLADKIKTIEDLEKYSKEDLKLNNPRILYPKIKINTLFNVNGFKMHLSGRTLDRLVFKGAMQLILPDEMYAYVRKIEKYIERNREKRKTYPLTEHQKITSEDNLKLYDILMDKLKNTSYSKKLSAQIATFENGREIFLGLGLVDQCEFLYNAFNLFKTSPAASDLTLIKGVKSAGILLIQKNISEKDSIYIINQSVTGLFEKEEDLNRI